MGKTTTCANLGIGLAQEGKRVLLVDSDPQGSLTISLGFTEPDKLSFTLATAMSRVVEDQEISPGEGILHHAENVDLVPANIELAGMEVSLINAMSREKILKQYLEPLKQDYDYILIDCMPSLGMLTINALAASNRVIIPVQANYLSAKGLEQLLQTIAKVRRQINPKLQIEGILLTMVDSRTNNARMIPVLLIMTSNAPDTMYSRLVQNYQQTLNTFVGPTEVLVSGDTLQLKDYGKTDWPWSMFNPEAKRQRHETVFPEEMKKAFRMGAALAK